MKKRKQRTLKNTIRCVGVGLNDGRRVELVLKPAKPDQGIVFKRKGEGGPDALPANWKFAAIDKECATLENDGEVAIRGIEQLLSAAAGAGLDNLEVEIDGVELPILDGSAEPFFFLLSCAGLVEQEAPCRTLRIIKPLEVREDKGFARLEPYEGFALDVEIEEEHPMIGKQRWYGDITVTRYQEEIARARAFASESELRKRKAEGRLKGETLDNFLVFGEDKALNAGGLRYPDEPVRHKVLEIIGDLSMVGAPIQGRFRGKGVHHGMVLKLIEQLFDQPKNWEWQDPGGR